ELARFKAEAEALARMHHPNIVQIYTVGEHDGRPFLSLEFVEGGSLARKLQGRPLPSREAADLVQDVARGVEAAHRCGVLHPDLNRANIRLTADGTPKVTVWGVARRLDQRGKMTEPGLALGPPCYMAPEQARGERDELGPPADVYAL